MFLIASSQESKLLGVYSYGNGFNSRSIELTDNNVINEYTNSDFIGSRSRKRVATYKLIDDSLFVHPRKRGTLLDSLYLVKSTDYLTALVPNRQIHNWEKQLDKLDSLSRSKLTNKGFLIRLFEEYRIFVRPK